MRTFFTLIFFVLIVACNQKKIAYKREGINVYFKSFPSEENLIGNPVKLSKELLVARRISILDSLLIINDSQTAEEHIHIFNLNDYRYITSAVSKGEGPGELTSVSSVFTEKGKLYLHDAQTQKLLAIDINNILQNEYRYDSFSTRTHQKSSVLRLVKSRDMYIGDLMPAFKNRIQVFDENLDEISSFGNFPPFEKKGSIDSMRFLIQVKGYLFQGNLESVPQNNLLLIAHHFTDIIEVFDISTNENILNIIGPEQNYPPKYELLNDGFGVPCKGCKYAYNTIRFYNNKIYALYSGIEEQESNAHECRTLFVFDLNGMPLKKITLNVSLTDFVLTEKDGHIKMYGLSPDSEDASLYEFIIQ